jgi:hypothetical protein
MKVLSGRWNKLIRKRTCYVSPLIALAPLEPLGLWNGNTSLHQTGFQLHMWEKKINKFHMEHACTNPSHSMGLNCFNLFTIVANNAFIKIRILRFTVGSCLSGHKWLISFISFWAENTSITLANFCYSWQDSMRLADWSCASFEHFIEYR